MYKFSKCLLSFFIFFNIFCNSALAVNDATNTANKNATNTANKTELAQKLIQSLRMAENMEDTIKQSTVAMMASMKGNEQHNVSNAEIAQAVAEFMRENNIIQQFITQMASLYENIFTEEELIAIINFNNSPVGQKLVEKQPLVAVESMKIANNIMMANQESLFKKMAELFNSKANPPGAGATNTPGSTPNKPN